MLLLCVLTRTSVTFLGKTERVPAMTFWPNRGDSVCTAFSATSFGARSSACSSSSSSSIVPGSRKSFCDGSSISSPFAASGSELRRFRVHFSSTCSSSLLSLSLSSVLFFFFSLLNLRSGCEGRSLHGPTHLDSFDHHLSSFSIDPLDTLDRSFTWLVLSGGLVIIVFFFSVD